MSTEVYFDVSTLVHINNNKGEPCMKKFIAVLAALAMMISLAACGNYEITIQKNEDEKTQASDSVKEEKNDESEEKEEKKNKENKKEDKEEKTEEETIVIDGVPEFTNDVKQNKKLIEAYLRTFVDFDDFDEKEEEDDLDEYGYYTMTYERESHTDANINLEIALDGNEISMPADLETLEEIGVDFKASSYNSDSEFKDNTYGDIEMKNSDDEVFKATFFNNTDSKAALSECMITGFTFDYGFERDVIDFSFNGIDENSSLEDIVSEFGTPSELSYQLYDDGNVTVYVYYENWTDGESWADEKLSFRIDLCEEKTEYVSYEIPIYSFD